MLVICKHRFYKKLPGYFPKCLYHFAFPQTKCGNSSCSASLTAPVSVVFTGLVSSLLQGDSIAP